MSRSTTYVDDLVSGAADFEGFDDVVEAWHEQYAGKPAGEYPEIYEYLGMTWPEYALVLSGRQNLKLVVEARRHGLALTEFARGDAKSSPSSV